MPGGAPADSVADGDAEFDVAREAAALRADDEDEDEGVDAEDPEVEPGVTTGRLGLEGRGGAVVDMAYR